MKTFFLPLLLLMILSSATCENTNEDATDANTATSKTNILNTQWHLESMTLAGKSHHIFPATLEINEQKISGKGGCNNFFGQYELNGDQIKVSKIGSTRMYCQDASKFESSYLKALEQVTHYTQKENRLNLMLPNGELIFSSNPLETADDMGSILGTKWKLKSIVKSGVSSRSKKDITFTIDKNKVAGNGGCNNYSGTLRMEGDRFDVSDIIATELYCEEGVSDIEMDYLRALEKVSSFKLENKRLILLFPKGELLFEKQ